MTSMAAKAPSQIHVTSHTAGQTGQHPTGTGTSATGSATATVTTATQRGPAACTTADLHVSVGAAEGAAGSTGQVVDFQNVSRDSCSLFGFPGVSFTSRRAPGSQLGLAASRIASPPATVVSLAPGQTAHTLVQIADALNYPTAACRPVKASYLQVYVPDQRQQVYLRYPALTCSRRVPGALSVTVVQRGRDRLGN